MFTTSTIILGFAVTFASAQVSGLGLSDSCQATILQTANNQDAATCLNIGGLLGVITTPANTSYVPKIDSWIGGICTAAPCTTTTLNSLASNISAGCATDLQSGSSAINLTAVITQYYPTIRRVLCLKDNNANKQICLTGELNTIETAIGHPLDLQTLEGTLSGAITFNTTTVPKSIICGACSQASYSIVKSEQPALVSDPSIEAAIKQECGDAFVTGGIPSTITDAGANGNSSPSAKAGAAVALTPASAMHWGGLASTMVVTGITIFTL